MSAPDRADAGRRGGWRPGRLAGGTAHGVAWQAVRIALQAANIVLLTHALGARGYGALAGSVALYTTLAQLVGSGSGITLLRLLSRQPDQAPARWAATQLLFLLSGTALFALAWPFAWWLLGADVPASTLGLLGLAELVAAPAVQPSALWLLSAERAAWCNALLTIPAAARLGAGLLLLLPGTTLQAYALGYLALSGCMALCTAILLRPPAASWTRQLRELPRLAREGLPYLLSNASVTAGAEIDKTLLLRLLGPLQAGQYAAAFRIAQAAIMPVNAFVVALSPRLFRGAAVGSPATIYLLTALAYGAFAAAGTFLLAPWLQWLLGPEFAASSSMLRLLCFYILANCTRQLVAALLTGADQQWTRNLLEALAMAAALGANLALIPVLGWQAAAVAAVGADLLVVAGGLAVMRRRRR